METTLCFLGKVAVAFIVCSACLVATLVISPVLLAQCLSGALK